MEKHLLRKAPPNLVSGRNWRDLSTARALPGITCSYFALSLSCQFSGSGFIVIKLACSFSPYMTAVNASVVGSGPILEKKNIKHCCGKRLLKRLKNTKSCSNPDTDESNRKSSKN